MRRCGQMLVIAGLVLVRPLGAGAQTVDNLKRMSLEELILRHAFGEDVDGIERESIASGVMMIPIPRWGLLRKVAGLEAARAHAHIEEVRIMIPVGQEVVPLPEGTRYLGFIFARASAPEAVESALREAHAELRFEIVPSRSASAPV